MQDTVVRRPACPRLDAILGHRFPVLDQGFVEVVDYMGGDSSVVRAARVSYGKGTRTRTEDRRLIDYLMRHGHTSPFEMAVLVLHVKLPMFLRSQWLRHRTASVNEVSARFSLVPDEFYRPAPSQICGQASAGKQRSSGVPVKDAEVHIHKSRHISAQGESAFATYRGMLAGGVSRETARVVLPVGSYTEFVWKMDLHNLMGFLRLRCGEDAQPEFRAYALEILKILELWVPMTAAAFREHRLEGLTLSRGGLVAVKRLLAGEDLDSACQELSASQKAELCQSLGIHYTPAAAVHASETAVPDPGAPLAGLAV